MIWSQGGWELDESVEEAAYRESLEEAGVMGMIEVYIFFISFVCLFVFSSFCFKWLRYNFVIHMQRELGQWNFISKRYGIYYEGHMFPMFVKEQLDTWPEKNLRRRIWVCLGPTLILHMYVTWFLKTRNLQIFLIFFLWSLL